MADEQEKAFQEWLERVMQFPLPKNKLQRVKALAKDLAEGASQGFWDTTLVVRQMDQEELGEADYFPQGQIDTLTVLPVSSELRSYFARRWGAPLLDGAGRLPEYSMLFVKGYAQSVHRVDDGFGNTFEEEIGLLGPAFDLIGEIEASNVFISYKRSESSAFALLILARLKEIGLSPFVDMAIEPGANWKDFLKERIDGSDFVVVLLGKETLKSSMTQQEIMWAKQAGKVIIPIWHNGFQYKSAEWSLMPDLDSVLTNTHTIIVQNESAGGYNNALVELMNRFGFTP